MIKAVIFDKDGVLIDSEQINIESQVNAYCKIGALLSKEDIRKITGRHPSDTFEMFRKKYCLPKKLKKQFIKFHKERYLKNYSKARIFGGVREVLTKLKRAGYKLGMATSGARFLITVFCKRTKLQKFFDETISASEVKKLKPNPAMYLKISQKLKEKPKNCVVIEDTIVGIEAAKRAGMKCIAITNTYSKRRLVKADMIINKLEQINNKLIQKMER